MKKIVVYDCDGVLFDSLEAVKAYYDYVFNKFSLPMLNWDDPETLNTAMMKTNSEIIREFSQDDAKYEEIMEFASNLNFKKFLDKMVPNPGIHDALKELSDKGYRLAVLTNRGLSLDYLLKHFDMYDYFERLVCSFDVVKPKPHPEGLYKLIDHFSCSKEEILFLGDSTNDYYAAESAKVPFLAFGNDLFESPRIDHHMDVFEYL
ncbi:HAD family hydrolase [Limisalsivibrio acetivorans]|uniref:HAD family hydrolase n=1 Tax=Limisalsivibrio acetivorans TaxID=1304888 RepID=UPI0003B3D09F|nr:HAD-IA family hydrolase [Limisalsivibrio acetivorans]